MESVGREMRDWSLQHPYKRLSSDAGAESTREADQDPAGDQGQPLQPQSATRTTTTFDSARQTRTILFKETLRWIGTVILAALIVITLRIYEGKRNFPSDQKTVFNTIVTALILGCGLNLFVSHDPAIKAPGHSRMVAYYIIGSIQGISKTPTMEDPSGRAAHQARSGFDSGY